MKSPDKTGEDETMALNTKKGDSQNSRISHGAESWNRKALDRQKIGAFEMYVPNQSILAEVEEPQRLSQLVNCKILRYFGHISRHESNTLEQLVVYGKLEGTRSRTRSSKR